MNTRNPERTGRKRPKKKIRLGILILICVLVYAGIAFLTQNKQLRQANAQTATLNDRMEALEQKKSMLERKESYVGTDEYVESFVRDKLCRQHLQEAV